MRSKERPISDVPGAALVALIVAFALQLAWHHHRPMPSIDARALPDPPSIEVLRVAAAGEPGVAAKLVMLWLQAFDNQAGLSIPFSRLDYDKVAAWLERILELDPRAQYPLLAASRVYGAVHDEQRVRTMLEFVHREFLEDPDRRWRWMAHAAITAKHRLGDLPLALEYARSITDHATGPQVPQWARHMTVLLLEDMGELESAVLLIYKLIESGLVTDPHELRFLTKKLEELEADLEARG